MPILNRLVDIYERRGFKVASGLNADAFGGFWLAPFTWLFDGDGVYAWGLFEDVAEPGRYLEYFAEESWLAHLRHHERVTQADRAIQE